MSEVSNSVIPAIFRPLEDLKQRPQPVLYDQIHDITRGQSTREGDVLLSNIIMNELDENTSLDRNTILERLQTNGFLVKPCESKSNISDGMPNSSIDTPLPSIDSSNTPNEKESETNEQEPSYIDIIENTKIKGRKLNQHIQLDENIEKDLEKEMAIEKDPEKEESLELPSEPKYDESKQLQIDKSIVFIVCSSKDEEKGPGKEPSEKIAKHQQSDYEALGKIPKWRQKLCNSYDSPFDLDGKRWKNVDHYLIAAQYRNYSLENALEQYDDALNIQKSKKYKTDLDFQEREKQEIFHALYAKFTQHPELSRILEATKNAQLFYRVNKQKKKEFTELMWLREYLREYVRRTLKPLAEEPMDPKIKKQKNDLEKEYDLSEISIGEYGTQLPQTKPDVIKASSYYLNNRTQYIQRINELFKKYSEDGSTQSSTFDLLAHQKVVRDYLDIVTPYRGLLVYHNLGTGKSCTSIAVTEGMKNNKRVVIMVPASLKRNYEYELQKCGDLMYRQNQYWEFVSADGRPELIPILAKALSMSTREVENNKGAWMVNINKPANFKNLSPDQQKQVRDQLHHMIHQKYSFLHYNANNLGTKINEMKKISKNPFDHTTIVVDEAHNLMSNIVGNLKKKQKDSVYIKLYDMLMDATNLKVVMLSGTPIINYPQEISVLFNVLRGYIYTWTFKIEVKTKEKVNTDYIRYILDKNNCVVYDYIEYTRNTLIVTRNPYGFVNVNESKSRNYSQKAHKHPNAQTRRNEKFGGYGKYGVKLDDNGNISNDEFKKQIIHVLKRYDLIVTGTPKVTKEKCLPDDEKTFQTTFVKGDTNYKDKNNTTADILHIQTLKRRILGLTSYFRSPNEALLPSFVLNSNKSPFHEVRIPMSDYQFGDYAKVRKVELEKEKKQKKLKAVQKGNHELFQMASSYRVFSRTFCNFAFPVPPGRPFPKIKQGEEENEDMADGKNKDQDSIVNEDEYEKQIESAMAYLRENRDTLLSKTALKQYSPKMLEMLNNIQSQQNDGLHLVYSNFVTMEGIGIFEEVLKSNGFQEFKIKKDGNSWVLDYENNGKYCYALYTGKEDPDSREIVRNIYNGDWDNVPDSISLELRKRTPNNFNGEVIKVFMITAAGAEGINLKNTRFVHIMEPYWHNVRLEQVIGRARRINSHEALPKEKRTVQVFLYMSIMSESHKKDDKFKEIQVNDLSKMRDNTPVTTDEYLYEIAQMKQKINGQFLRVIKETAMDCHLYIQKHKKHEPLVCYGKGFSADRNFVSYPSIKTDLQEDMNKPEKMPIDKPVAIDEPEQTEIEEIEDDKPEIEIAYSKGEKVIYIDNNNDIEVTILDIHSEDPNEIYYTIHTGEKEIQTIASKLKKI
uniref:Helicase C-terminal domain-containing protein n=1 Tax=viral metagenome TaxID=1070528 RepID=A0A6C0CKH8_9ZZZZ